MNITANVTSVTYSYSPSFQREPDTVSLLASHSLALGAPEESLFQRRGDYWVIRYQGHVAFLKATRGLHFLSVLLHHPEREFHVSELLGRAIGKAVRATATEQRNGLFFEAGPILDAKAKAEYKQRLEDLRGDLEEAERFTDLDRAEQARNEISAIAEQLASAVGFGGRDRRIASEEERARSAVTKQIKASIKKIGEAIPSLGRHLTYRVKTGYFCFYSRNPDRPIAWEG